MSLAPAERQALARIESSLRCSDPRLASMLTQFRLPLFRGGSTGLTRRLPQLWPFISLMVALIVVFLFVLTVVLSPGKPSPCGVHSGPGFAIAAGQVTGCSPASHGSQGDGAGPAHTGQGARLRPGPSAGHAPGPFGRQIF